MGLFSSKNETAEYRELKAFEEYIQVLDASDKYLSKKDYSTRIKELSNHVADLRSLESHGVLVDWCKRNRCDYKEIIRLMKNYAEASETIKKHNERFINSHLCSEASYLNEILKEDDPNILLDEEQRRVILSDEDYTLVVAGAGAGKTTTIEAKVKYLVDKQGISPERILVVSFTRKATEELKSRFARLKLRVEIATFHSIGNSIIKNYESVNHQIVNIGFMFKSVQKYLASRTEDEAFIKKLLLFFASYLQVPFDESNTALLFKLLNDDNLSTLKADLKTKLDTFQNEQTKNHITINDERVRSIDECRIANFLYINGIDYTYEPIYQYGFKNSTKPYCPDFVIKQGDKNIYLEHFGISQDGHNNRFTKEELEAYKRQIADKIELHKKHGTMLIYTYSKYDDGRDLITHLVEELKAASIVLDSRNSIDIYQKIAQNAEDKYFSKFIQLLCTFIGRFKVSNFDESKFDEWLIGAKDERTKLFISICRMCYKNYKIDLNDSKAIDFEDMINNASNILDKTIEEGEKLPYDYIIVDEYQDISLQRFDLCEKLSRASDAKIMAVGDDWQSVFRFSGAKIDLFTKFEERMGYANVLKITKVYRNSQELIEIAGKFVMSNDEQIPKELKSNKTIKNPVILMSYNDSYEKDEKDRGPYYRLGEAIEQSLDHIVDKFGQGQSVLVIGRYNFEGKNLGRLDDLFIWDEQNEIVKSRKYPSLKIDFLTAHSSKGLGYDNVIIINGKDDILGFPSKIEDDPLMKLVIKDEEKIDFAEERRLFYVALTRTKNRVYIVTPQHHPSKFILEIKDRFTNVILSGTELNPTERSSLRPTCPDCGYPLQRRSNYQYKFLKPGKSLWICSNEPELCGFLTNDLRGGKLRISKCHECEDGYLVVKSKKDKDGRDTGDRMLGCTNYKKDGTGCHAQMNLRNFTQDKSKLAQRFFDKSMPIEKMLFAGCPIKELVDTIISTLKIMKTRNFTISYTNLKQFLTGTITKVTEHIKENSGFGIIDPEHRNKLDPLLRVMIEHEIISIDKDNYNSIVLNIDEIDNFTYITLFAELVR